MNIDKLENEEFYFECKAPGFTIDQLHKMGMTVYVDSTRPITDLLNMSNKFELEDGTFAYDFPFVLVTVDDNEKLLAMIPKECISHLKDEVS